MSHQDEDFIDDCDDNIKTYFASLFKNRSQLWKEFKLLLSPIHLDENQEYSDHLYSAGKNDGIKSLFIKAQEQAVPEEEEEGWEVVVLNNPRNHEVIPSLGKNQLPSELVVETKDEEEEEKTKAPTYHKVSNRAASLYQNMDLVGDVREVIIRAPKKKPAPDAE